MRASEKCCRGTKHYYYHYGSNDYDYNTVGGAEEERQLKVSKLYLLYLSKMCSVKKFVHVYVCVCVCVWWAQGGIIGY